MDTWQGDASSDDQEVTSAEAFFGPGARWTKAPEELPDWSEKQEQALQEHYELDDPDYCPTWKFG